MNDETVPAAVVKVVAVGTAAGVAIAPTVLSLASFALLWVQILAGLVAIVYGVAQLFFLLRDKWWRER